MADTVRVPEEFEELFDRAEQLVAGYFGLKRETPEHGLIDIEGERYVLVRARSLSVDFFDMMKSLYPEREDTALAVGRNLLFHLAHFVGRSDARALHSRLELTDPLARLSAGPVHFSHTGWAFVDIHPESRPSPDENYFLVYDHPYSFESDSWCKARRRSSLPVCLMNAGYSSGWCEESFGIPLVATEILCMAKGDPSCRFVMAPPSRIREQVATYLEAHPGIAGYARVYEVPGEFRHQELEQRLQVSEKRFRDLFETARDAIVLVEYGHIQHANEQATKLFGLSRRALRGRRLDSLSPGRQSDDRPSAASMAERMSRALEGQPETFPWLFHRPGGETVATEISLSAVPGAGRGVQAIIRDLTDRVEAEAERERLQREVIQLQKMDALGILAGGVAHDFNNILTSVKGNLDLVRAEVEEGSEASASLEDARIALDRAAGVVRQLLTFARTSPNRPEVVDLSALVEENVRLLRETFDRRIRVRISHSGPPALVRGDSNFLSQVIVNLALNGRDALLERLAQEADDAREPELRLDTAVVTGISLPGHSPDPEFPHHVRLVVRDNGTGMDRATQERAFEPFYSNKPTGKGAGLGLSTVYGIVQQHGGWVVLESAPGEGTEVRVYLPHAPGPVPEAPESGLPPASLTGTETVLFVDDEVQLRSFARRTLEKLGYRVLMAGDGVTAVETYRRSHDEIDLVVMDQTMPRQSGLDALREMLVLTPDLRVILASGYAGDTQGPEPGESGMRTFLPKPYGALELAQAVRQALDAPGPESQR